MLDRFKQAGMLDVGVAALLGRLGRVDQFGDYHSPNVADALFFGLNSNLIYSNAGGAPQVLPGVNVFNGREKCTTERITLAAQASGSQIMVARLPLFSTITGVTYLTDTSLATATIALGDAGAGNSAIYAAAQTLTTTQTPTRVGLAASHAQPITSGFDANGNAVTPYAPGEGGAGYEDIIITTGVAALPGAGTLVVIIEYLSPDS